MLLPKLDAENFIDNFPDRNHGTFDGNKYQKMYLNISKSILLPVFKKYQVDADMFGYSFDGYFVK